MDDTLFCGDERNAIAGGAGSDIIVLEDFDGTQRYTDFDPADDVFMIHVPDGEPIPELTTELQINRSSFLVLFADGIPIARVAPDIVDFYVNDVILKDTSGEDYGRAFLLS